MRTSTKFPWVVRHKDIVLKLYNWMDYPKNQFARNVEAFDLEENHLWTIEALEVYKGQDDCYTNILSKGDSIHAFSYSCFNCVIDERKGKIVSKKFTK